MRLGFLTAHPLLLQKVDLHTANTNLQCSSTTQALALLLLEHWGIEGFLQHTDRVADFYRDKRDKIERVARKWLDGLADWVCFPFWIHHCRLRMLKMCSVTIIIRVPLRHLSRL